MSLAQYTLINGNCLDKMASLPNESIDLIVTSPPYDELRTYNGYSFEFEKIAKEIFRVMKNGGVVVWVVGDGTVNGSETGTSFRQALYFKDECGFRIHDTMIYQKSQCCFGSNNCYLQSFEYMFVFSKGKPKTLNLIRDRKNKRSGVESVAGRGLLKDGTKSERVYVELKEYGKRKNIWEYGVGGGKVDHPAVFPLELARDHILSWSNEGDTVLDPFMGSGTTGLASLETNRCFVGIEISDKYFQISKNRIELFISENLS